MDRNRLTLGVDCGGTNLKLALVKGNGTMVRSKLVPVSYSPPPKVVIRKLGKEMNQFLKENKNPKIQCIGMGIAGDVDSQKGVVRFSPNLNWKNVPLRRELQKIIKKKIVIENDANCAAWGAYWLEAKRKCNSLICLTLGTGVGGGIIIHHKIFRGVSGSAGELGHMSIDIQGPKCKCGSYGCVESYLGASALVRMAKNCLKKDKAPFLKKYIQKHGLRALSPKAIGMAARHGDRFCKNLWDEAGEKLGAALANIVNVFNPEWIVLSGGVSKAGSLILSPAIRSMKARAFKSPSSQVKVSVSKYDERLGVVGAALLNWE